MSASSRRGAAARAGSTLALVTSAMLGLTGIAAAEDSVARLDRASLALLQDMEMMVDNQETTGWTIDHYEYEEMMPDAVYSVCLAPKAARTQALAWANARVNARGGPLDAALAAGRKIDELDDLLFAIRVAQITDMAISEAEGKCSPWEEPSADFRGVHTDAGRLTLNLETGGVVLIQRAGGERDFGGGFAVRMMGGYGFDHHYTLLAGAELLVSTLFPRGEDAGRFPIQYVLSAPLVLRHRLRMWHHDVEAGPVILFSDDDKQPSYGFRVGALLGVSTLRIRHIMPWIGPGIAIEYLFENDARPATAAIKGGARLGFDWDF